MQALTDLATQLHFRSEGLTALEWRTYIWARASLAVLMSIRAEDPTLA